MLPSAQACIRAIEEQLPALLRRRASALHEQMKEAQQQSLAPVTTTAEHANYLVTLRDLGPYLPCISPLSPLSLPNQVTLRDLGPRLERLEAGYEQATLPLGHTAAHARHPGQ